MYMNQEYNSWSSDRPIVQTHRGPIHYTTLTFNAFHAVALRTYQLQTC